MRKGEDRRMLDDLASIHDSLPDWEKQFCGSLLEQIDEEERPLTPKQAKLTEIHEKRVLGY